MQETKKPFFSISDDIDDAALERIARAKGVPEMSSARRSVPERPAASQVSALVVPAEEAGAAAPKPAERAMAKPVKNKAAPTPRANISYVKAGLPEYTLIELKTRALQEKVSLNHLLLKALKGMGITVHDADLIEDGRRLRGKNAH